MDVFEPPCVIQNLFGSDGSLHCTIVLFTKALILVVTSILRFDIRAGNLVRPFTREKHLIA
jgi:hypothetical protein